MSPVKYTMSILWSSFSLNCYWFAMIRVFCRWRQSMRSYIIQISLVLLFLVPVSGDYYNSKYLELIARFWSSKFHSKTVNFGNKLNVRPCTSTKSLLSVIYYITLANSWNQITNKNPEKTVNAIIKSINSL